MAFDEERPVDEFVRDSESAGGELATGGENTLEESAVDDQGSGFIEKDALEQGTGESEGPKEDALLSLRQGPVRILLPEIQEIASLPWVFWRSFMELLLSPRSPSGIWAAHVPCSRPLP